MTQHIAIMGKGGVGKTTIAANVGAALAESGSRVMLIGCDAKSDSSNLLCGNRNVPTLLDLLRNTSAPSVGDVVVPGYRGIACIEIGDATEEPCVSRSIGQCLDVLQELNIIEQFAPDAVIYDLPGEIGCAGLASWLNRVINRALVVTSADLPFLLAANSFFRVLERHGQINAELVANGLAGSFDESLAADFAGRIGVTVGGTIPRSLVVRHSELYGKTVLETAPRSNQATVYHRLACHLLEKPRKGSQLRPLPTDALKQWARAWGERLGEAEFGILRDGGGI